MQTSFFSLFSHPSTMAYPQPRRPYLKALVVFRNCIYEELIRGIHVYGEGRVMEREYLFDEKSIGYQEMICPARVFTAHKFTVHEHFPGSTDGIWECIFTFHSGVKTLQIPEILSLKRNPNLALVPNLVRDLDAIYRFAGCDEEVSDSTAMIQSRGTQDRPLFDLNCLPSEYEDEDDYPMMKGTKERKYKRAASKDIANITLEELSKYFDVPIADAAKGLNIGLTALKRKCREFGIPRWPHRKIKSLGTLIHDLQGELEKQQAVDEISALAVARRQRMLETEKEKIVRRPTLEIEKETKRFRQDVFKRRHKAKVQGEGDGQCEEIQEEMNI